MIVAQAGKFGAVTIATNMAGRGTDIVLGGNAEFMAKSALVKMGTPEELIAEADSFAETDNEEILAVRSKYEDLLKYYKSQIAEGSRVETLLGGEYGEVDYTPDQHLVTALSMGKAPTYTEDDTTLNETTPEGSTPDESRPEGSTPADTEPVEKKGCKSFIALPAFLTLLAAGYAMTKRRD